MVGGSDVAVGADDEAGAGAVLLVLTFLVDEVAAGGDEHDCVLELVEARDQAALDLGVPASSFVLLRYRIDD